MKKIGKYSLLFIVALLILGGCGRKKTDDQKEPGDLIDMTEFMEDAFAPAPIQPSYASEEPCGALAGFLADYYRIPESDWAQTAYYYQYYDFDGDGADEIFAVLVSEKTRDGAGDPALLLEENKEENIFTTIESFERVHTPIIAADEQTNGWHDLILNQYGNGQESGYLYCRYEEGAGYQHEGNELLDEIPEELTGDALLSDNMIDDRDKGTYLTLGD